MIKAICFDLDGVYFTPDGKKGFENSLISLTQNKEKVVYTLYKSPEMLTFVKGHMSEHAFWNFVRDYLQINLSDEELTCLWTRDYQINTKVREYIKIIRSKGYRSCTCSNNNPARVKSLDKKFRFLSDFDITIFSYEVGFVKPDPEIFQVLITKAQVQPNELVYSDDNPERLHGAKEAGIVNFQYENFEQFVSELQKLGVS